MQYSVVIVAGGSGSRMNSTIPKQFLPMAGVPVLARTIQQFIHAKQNIEVIVVLPDNQMARWSDIQRSYFTGQNIKKVPGGETRYHSVKNGLNALANNGLVAVHDGVRPLVSRETILRCFEGAAIHGSAVPVIDVHETLRKVSNNNSYTVNREDYKLVQTPQVFQHELLMQAYQQPFESRFTDDASVFESAGNKINLVAGNRENIKITTPDDLAIAEALLGGEW